MIEHYVIIGITVAALILFASEIIRADFIAIFVALTLMILGYVTVNEGFSGFSNPAVITVIAMFILSSGLVRTGVADYVADLIMKFGGKSPIILTLMVMLCVGTMSAFMNNIGAVAILLPTLFIISQNLKYPINKLLIPLSFGSLLGGLVTLIGTPPNLLISTLLEDNGFTGFKMFDYAPTGLVIMIAGVLYMIFIGRHLIPVREKDNQLTNQFLLDNYLSEVVLPVTSKYVNKTIQNCCIHDDLGFTVLRIQREKDNNLEIIEPKPDTLLLPNDKLIIEGNISKLIDNQITKHIQLTSTSKFSDIDLTKEGIELSEAVVSNNSHLIGRSIVENDIHKLYGVIVLALKRGIRTVVEGFQYMPIEAGDVFLVKGKKEAITNLALSPDFTVVNRLEHDPRHSKKAPLALLIMFLTILSAALGILHISVAGILGAFIMTLTGCVKMEDIYNNVEWRVIFLIAGMMPLGIAMDNNHTGTAQWLANNIVTQVGDYGPLVMLGTIYLFTTIITQIMSNAAAALLIGPIALAISGGFGLQPYPFMMAVAISASTSFLTPISHQANMLVYGVGNYKFMDFVRVGGPLNLIILIISLILIPIIFPFKPL
ncbi:MAG: SLC13 family permease [Candidatus Kapabacteria bacterium]|nr:SLC13 family permease [Candidatus Kapabacteria bacterium]